MTGMYPRVVDILRTNEERDCTGQKMHTAGVPSRPVDRLAWPANRVWMDDDVDDGMCVIQRSAHLILDTI